MTMVSRTLDTSVLYAAFDEADPRHEGTQRELSRPEPLHVPLTVMAEFLDLVTYRRDRKVARQVYADLAQLPHLRFVPVRDEHAALAIWRQRPSLSVVDATVVQSCLERNDALLSYDRRQAKALAELRPHQP